MKVIKLIILILICYFCYSSNFLIDKRKKKSKTKIKKRIDQKLSGICGFVAVLEAALDFEIELNGKKTDKEYQEYLPTFIDESLKYLNTKGKLENIFKESTEYANVLNGKFQFPYKSPEEMLNKFKKNMELTEDYRDSYGIFLSYKNLMYIADFAKLNIDIIKSNQIFENGSLNIKIDEKSFKNYPGCIVGLSSSITFWFQGDILYNPIKNQNQVTSHWIYVTKLYVLKNYGKSGYNETKIRDMIDDITDKYDIITEVLCFK